MVSENITKSNWHVGVYWKYSLNHTLVSSLCMVINEIPLHRMEMSNIYSEKRSSKLVLSELFGTELLTISPTNSDSTSSVTQPIQPRLCISQFNWAA